MQAIVLLIVLKNILLFASGEKVTGASSDHDHNHNDKGHNNGNNGSHKGNNGPHKGNNGPHKGHHGNNGPHHHFDRCKELVFDAAIENKEGVHYFFKGEYK